MTDNTLTTAQQKALAEVAAKKIVYVAERNQAPEFEGTKARAETLDVLIINGLIERGERTNFPGGFSAVVNITPRGRAVLDDIAAAEKAAAADAKKPAAKEPAAEKQDDAS